ncbi:condensin complex subunit 3-like [Apostichopus japonicus]|uniref:condensin complex subunit 3-like n=1 Tax=Stichopus japonicus TaxID=307972 RepID=UPI003AB6A9FA
MPSGKPLKTVSETFEECQKGIHSHDKLVSGLRKTYEKFPSKDEFKEEFVNHLKFSMVIFRREAAVERTLDFAAKFITSFAADIESDSDREGKTTTSGEEQNFMLFMFDFLLLSHNANDRAVRFRVCQMLNKLLNSLGEDAQIDDELYNRIYQSMLQRLKDKCPMVRIQAVTALARLQDPEDAECPVITAYMYLLNHDPHFEVRRMILSCIAPSRKTLPALLERTRDVKEGVRKLAYTVLSEKVSIKSLTIEQRVKLLQDGLQDRSESVVDACSNKLLQSWLRTFAGNILEVLHALDVEYNTQVGEMALKVIFKKAEDNSLIKDFDLLDENHVIPSDKLDSEAVLYWKCMCAHFTSLEVRGEEQMDKVLPSVSDFCDYIHTYMKKIKPRALNETEIERALEQEFVSAQLLKIASLMDMSDEVGRKKMDELTRELMLSPNIPASLVEHLATIFNKINTSNEIKVSAMAEIISDIREPISLVETSISDDEIRQREIKLAGVKMELNVAKDELEETVSKQDFERAAELKQRIEELEMTRESLLEETMNKTVAQEVRTEKTDAVTLFKCLTISSEILKSITMKELNPTLVTLMDTLVVPCIKNEDTSVRNMAVQSLGLACLLNKDYALKHLLLFVQIWQIDHEFIQTTALKVILDLLLTFGFEALQISTSKTSVGEEEEEEEVEECEDGENKDEEQKTGTPLNSILAILTKQLDSESPDLRTFAAEGIAKLLLAGRIASPKLLSRLLLLWYNPTTEDDTRLRQSLAIFFNMYAFADRSHQESFEEAFLPTLQTLFNAPMSSPLAEISDSNVAQFLVHLTDFRNLKQDAQQQNMQETSVHDSLSIKICNSVLADPASPGVRILCRTLNLLHITMTNQSLIRDLQTLANKMIRDSDDKVNRNILKKFVKKMEDKMQDADESAVDGEEEEREAEASMVEKTDIEDKENREVETEENTEDEQPNQKKPDDTAAGCNRLKETTETEPSFKTPAVPRSKGRSKKTPATKGKASKAKQSKKDSLPDEEEETQPARESGKKTRGSRRNKTAASESQERFTCDSAEKQVTQEEKQKTRSSKKKIQTLTFSSDSEDGSPLVKPKRNARILKVLNYNDESD